MHGLNLLAIQVSNLLPAKIPWVDFNWHHGFTYTHSTWLRHAGRLLFATAMFVGGIAITLVWIKRPLRPKWRLSRAFIPIFVVWLLLAIVLVAIDNKWAAFWTFVFAVGIALFVCALKYRPSVVEGEPATWVQSILGAMFVWVMLTLGYGVIPHEWLIFGNSYLNFDTTTYVLRENQWGGHIPPFSITRDKVVDGVAAGIYVVVLVINVALFVMWQKREVPEVAAEEELTEDGEPKLSPLGRLRARREKRVSAYGRPVTTSDS
jgi:hypothetical protein